jgi:two-component system sensor histidine kinase PilS (NtrC family)
MAERVQQGKLAALGRLSASIAHEIRNPVGAMSHAGQLLAESPNFGSDERRLTDIIRNNSERVSTIINNVLQLSRREATKPTRLMLGDWIEEFLSEFCETMQVPATGSASARTRTIWKCASIPVTCIKSCGIYATTPSSTASRPAKSRGISVEIKLGRLNPSNRPYLEVADRGPGNRHTGGGSHLRAVFHRPQGRHRTRPVHRTRTMPA